MTIQWFGQHWGASICRICPHVDTPVGDRCADCHVAISPNDCGLMVWHIPRDEMGYYQPHHLDCFIETLGIRSPKFH